MPQQVGIMNFSRILAAGALAASYAFAQPVAPSVDQPEGQPAKKAGLNSKMGLGFHGQFEFTILYGLAQDWNLGDDEEAPSGIGFVAGLRGRIPMMPVVHFAPELNFHYARLTQQDEAAKRSFEQMDIEVPLMLRGILKDMFYVTAGAQLGFNLYSKAKVDFGSDDNGGYLDPIDIEYEEDLNKATFGFGLVLGAGFVFFDRISVDARFVLGLTEAYPNGESKFVTMDGAKQKSFQFGIGCWIL